MINVQEEKDCQDNLVFGFHLKRRTNKVLILFKNITGNLNKLRCY